MIAVVLCNKTGPYSRAGEDRVYQHKLRVMENSMFCSQKLAKFCEIARCKTALCEAARTLAFKRKNVTRKDFIFGETFKHFFLESVSEKKQKHFLHTHQVVNNL